VPVPTCTKVAIDAWTAAANLIAGHLFRPVNRADRNRRRSPHIRDFLDLLALGA
jgi:hypothetical protein